MDANDRCTNLGKKILPILLPSMVEAENVSDHPRNFFILFYQMLEYKIDGWTMKRCLPAKTCVTSSFRREVDENCTLLGYYPLRSSPEDCSPRPEHLQLHEKEVLVA
jgi:hypothetical protein